MSERKKIITHNLYEREIDDRVRGIKLQGWANIGTIIFISIGLKSVKAIGYYSGIYSSCLDYLDTFPMEIDSQKNKSKSTSPQPSIIGYFCKLVQHSGLKEIGNLSDFQYCKEVCNQFNLKYTRTINNYFSEPSREELPKISTQIYPYLSQTEIRKIEGYLQSKEFHG